MKIRCHASSAAEPVLAVADSEAGINLVLWSISEVFLSCIHGNARLTP